MTKPVIVLRADTAPSPLTYTELDQNFINLRDATHNYTVGGSTAQVNLNEALTFTAGTGISLSLDTVTDTITISSASSSNQISQGNTSVTVTDTGVGQIDFTVDGTLVSSMNDNELDMKGHNVINVANIVGIRTSIPDLRYQSVGIGASVVYPSGSTFSINLGTNTVYGRQTVWDITNCDSTVTCTLSMNYDSGHPSDLLFFNNGSSKTLNISIPNNSSSMFQKVFWADATQYSGASTKSLTLDSSRVTWLRFTKVMSEASGGVYTHWINVEFITNNRTIP